MYLPYFALHFTLNVRILSEVQPAELIDRGEKSEFFKSIILISKNDESSVQEKSQNTANALTEREIEFRIFLSTIFPEVAGTYLQRENWLFGNVHKPTVMNVHPRASVRESQLQIARSRPLIGA